MAAKENKAESRAKGKKLRRRLWNQRYLFLLMLPALIWVILICYAPMTGLYMAFTNYRPSQEGYFHDLISAPFVGWQWFEYFFQNDFAMIMRNTLATSILALLFSFPAPIILALMINEVRNSHFKKVVQTITYLPYFISLVVMCALIKTFCMQNGLFNQIGMLFGGSEKNYLAEPQYFRSIYVLSDIWQGIGWNSIIYLAALTGIDMELYEAARVDGANRWQKMVHITFPGLLPTVMILFILRMGNILNVGYEKILLLYNPNIYQVSDVISPYPYRLSFAPSGNQPMYSKSTAIGLFNTAVNVVFLLATNAISRKTPESGLF